MVGSQRSGELATQRLPGLLLDLNEQRATGTLALRRSGVVKTMELVVGEPVRVTSSLRDETLGHFLVRGGVISEAQHRDAVTRAARGSARLGETLVAMGVLRDEQLHQQLTLQDRHKLIATLRWPQGTWRFTPTTAPPSTAARALSMIDVVLTGLRDSGATDLDRLRRFDGASHALTARGRNLLPEVRRIFGEHAADALLRGGAVTAIERAAGDRFLARNVLDALELCGGIASQRLPTGLVGSAALATAREVTTPSMSQGEASLPRGVAPRRSEPSLPRLAAAVPLGTQPTASLGTQPGTGVPPLAPAPPSSPAAGASARALPDDRARPQPAQGVSPAGRAAAPPSPATPPLSAPPNRRSSPELPSLVRAGAPPQRAAVRVEGRAAALPTPAQPTAAPNPASSVGPAMPPSAAPEELGADAEPLSSRTATRREAWLPRTVTTDERSFLPRTITGMAVARAPTPWLPAQWSEHNPLYELLFDEQGPPTAEGSAPLTAFDVDSGVVSSDEIDAASEHGDAALRLRQALIAEAQYVRDADLYAVLRVERSASEAQIAAAISERQRAFSIEAYSRFPLGADQPRLDEVLAAYAGARSILLDEDARRVYDRGLTGGEAAAAYTLDAEVAFREAEDLLSRRRFSEAIALLEALIARAPTQADFHAALGWAHWQHLGPSPRAGDIARPHLSRALHIDPEHLAAHVYRGVLGAALHEDDAEVLFYLERALELQPARADALEHLEPILLRRGELRRLERLYKRLLFRLSSNFASRAAEIWLRLAQLYADQLDEHEAAAIALGNAEILAPNHPLVAEIGARIRAATIVPRHPLEAARAKLRRTRDPMAAADLIRSAGETGQPDAAFLTAATMVALGDADAHMAETYERHRVRRVSLPDQPLSAAQWNRLRHPDDNADLGALLDLVAPAVHQLAPVTLADAGIEASMRVSDDELPGPFQRVRARLARVFEVAPCPVFARPELERHIEVVACDPPALIAGDDALTAPERPELVCRMARAMSHARVGRAVGGSRSGTVLRAIVLAVIREASCSSIGERDPGAAQADAALDVLSIEARGAARAVALRLLARSNGLNLSVWSHSLPHTANRAALLLCGDIPTALRIARESGSLQQDLIEFAFSAEHAALRAALGLGIEP
jgi:tetratricopeptide (TPR) repeat protein